MKKMEFETCHIANKCSHRIISVLVLISACLFNNIGFTDAAITWISKPADASVPLNENVTIPCEVSGRGSEQVFWRKGEDTIAVINGQNVVTSNRDPTHYKIGTFSLTIKFAQKSHAGTYICEIFGGVTGSAVLTVLVPPGPPVFNAGSGAITEGNTVTFTCSSTGGNPTPTIEIYNRSGPLQTTVNTVGETTTATATKTVSYEDDKTNYTCKVFNQLLTLETAKLISVQYKPRVSILLESTKKVYNPLVVVENQPSTLLCNIAANPGIIGNVVWKKQGVIQPTEVNLQYSPTYLRTNSSEFSCTASNQIGTTEATIKVEVQYKPTIQNFPSGPELLLNETNELKVPCRIESANPSALVRWEKRGDPNSGVNGVTLFKEKVTRADSGEYTCIASNSLKPSGQPVKTGIEKKSILVRVQYEAEAFVKETQYSAFVNETVTIECHGKGLPKPTIEWSGPQGPIASNGANVNIQTTDTTGEYSVLSKLSLKITDKQHLGQYTCRAVNMLGAKSKNVDVNLKTVVLPTPEDVRYIVAESLLKFKSIAGQYCVQIEATTDNENWKVIEQCASTEGGSVKIENEDIKQINISFCLPPSRLRKMCGEKVEAERVEPPPLVSTQTIYIVAGVGALVVIILVIILIVVCCRRKKPEKEYPEAAHQRPKPVPLQNGSKRFNKPQGLDNPGLDTIDSSGMNYPTVFHTNHHHHHNQQPNHHHMHMNGYGSYGHMNGYPNGSIPYEHELDNVMKLDDPYLFTVDSNGEIRGDDSRSFNESGYSTPDPTKPKKVIYEVVV
ncbi:kin of IRRE-like protein 2 isoform X2 [Tubulanus polymorphus]|uniref:kin of IRRE-like protein 2 isoform X2 n=1 Tax=Tubulanus polymorphus TaxID=672921 RepID=UPI003DA41CD7